MVAQPPTVLRRRLQNRLSLLTSIWNLSQEDRLNYCVTIQKPNSRLEQIVNYDADRRLLLRLLRLHDHLFDVSQPILPKKISSRIESWRAEGCRARPIAGYFDSSLYLGFRSVPRFARLETRLVKRPRPPAVVHLLCSAHMSRTFRPRSARTRQRLSCDGARIIIRV